MKSREWCVCLQLQLKKMFVGFHLKIKIIHRHVVGGEKKVLQTENLWACITGQIVFVLESFGRKATRSERLLLILHMALQLNLYQNFVHTFNPASTQAKNIPPKLQLHCLKFKCSFLNGSAYPFHCTWSKKKSTWLTETLTFTPCPQHLQKP